MCMAYIYMWLSACDSMLTLLVGWQQKEEETKKISFQEVTETMLRLDIKLR